MDPRIGEDLAIDIARRVGLTEDARDAANADLKQEWSDAREQFKALGLTGSEVSREVGLLKAAIAATRMSEQDHAKAAEKADGVDSYVAVLTSPRARARARADKKHEPAERDVSRSSKAEATAVESSSLSAAVASKSTAARKDVPQITPTLAAEVTTPEANTHGQTGTADDRGLAADLPPNAEGVAKKVWQSEQEASVEWRPAGTQAPPVDTHSLPAGPHPATAEGGEPVASLGLAAINSPADVEGSRSTRGTDVGIGGGSENVIAPAGQPNGDGPASPAVRVPQAGGAPVLQGREAASRLAHNQEIDGASPSPATILPRRQPTFDDPPHALCLNPGMCGGFSNLALCQRCKEAAGIAVSHVEVAA